MNSKNPIKNSDLLETCHGGHVLNLGYFLFAQQTAGISRVKLNETMEISQESEHRWYSVCIADTRKMVVNENHHYAFERPQLEPGLLRSGSCTTNVSLAWKFVWCSSGSSNTLSSLEDMKGDAAWASLRGELSRGPASQFILHPTHTYPSPFSSFPYEAGRERRTATAGPPEQHLCRCSYFKVLKTQDKSGNICHRMFFQRKRNPTYD
ncbi:uncharacterized protein LOC134516283 [Chroicocephalus ridibundus]|uniref:uncharacterized protein LOC134516283 n=1 Tax=Chroicocephalus ridibundus TaxID=1192867 RepID=UPI002FDCF683